MGPGILYFPEVRGNNHGDALCDHVFYTQPVGQSPPARRLGVQNHHPLDPGFLSRTDCLTSVDAPLMSVVSNVWKPNCGFKDLWRIVIPRVHRRSFAGFTCPDTACCALRRKLISSPDGMRSTNRGENSAAAADGARFYRPKTSLPLWCSSR